MLKQCTENITRFWGTWKSGENELFSFIKNSREAVGAKSWFIRCFSILFSSRSPCHAFTEQSRNRNDQVKFQNQKFGLQTIDEVSLKTPSWTHLLKRRYCAREHRANACVTKSWCAEFQSHSPLYVSQIRVQHCVVKLWVRFRDHCLGLYVPVKHNFQTHPK